MEAKVRVVKVVVRVEVVKETETEAIRVMEDKPVMMYQAKHPLTVIAQV